MNKELQRLFNKVNKVTAYHRHGREVPYEHLTELSNAQVEYEQREDRRDDSLESVLNGLSEKLADLREGRVKVSLIVTEDKYCTSVELKTIEVDAPKYDD